MVFTLEALQANEGDCLLLYFGKTANPGILVIDGGPAGIYKGFLKPRLLKLKEQLSADDPLPLSMVMVSHLDDDHVNGVLALLNDIDKAVYNNEDALFDIKDMWFNTFDDIIGNLQIPAIAALPASAQVADINSNPKLKNFTKDEHEIAAIASTGQGRKLRDVAGKLTIPVNAQFDKVGKGKIKMVMGGTPKSKMAWDGLNITVVSPNLTRLNELQKEWDKNLKAALKKGDKTITLASLTLGDSDNSPFNLSSIVCLVEYKGKRILLTGDARSDDVLAGLKESKLLDKNGKLHVDILKMPHHGSNRNMSANFLEKITADHYVISANGKHGNPDQPTLDKICEVNKNVAGRTLYITNQTGEEGLTARMKKFIKDTKASKNKLNIVFRDSNKPSLAVNLLDSLSF